MDVAILYSGGKDSTAAIELAREKGWNIKYLLSVKPDRTDCYLFHFATVEHTKELAEAIGVKHFLIECTVADPAKEAALVKRVVQRHPVDAVILGGTGLQETQIRAVRDVLFPLGIEAFASHTGKDHGSNVEDLISRGYKIMITQIAADGLTHEWLGKILTEENFQKLRQQSEAYGFHVGGEGGHFDTLVVDAPFFPKKLEVLEAEKIMESECVGYLKLTDYLITEKEDLDLLPETH